MINYFTPKNVILLIVILLSSIFYQYLRDLLLKSAQINPNVSTSFNINSLYIGYTNYRLIQIIISVLGYGIYNIFDIKNHLL
jgi:hypothetical protein